MPTARLTSKGQATIPKDIREHLSLRPGDVLNFAIVGDHVVLRAKNKSIKEIAGLLYRPGQRAVSLSEMDEAIAEGAARRAGVGHKSARSLRRTG
jgi:AbrB family looped-hinge helix DNA binding protein